MVWVRRHALLAVLGVVGLGGGLLVWIIGALSGSLVVEAVGQVLYGLGWTAWGLRMRRKPGAASGRTSRLGPVWLIIAGIGFVAMAIVDLFSPGAQD